MLGDDPALGQVEYVGHVGQVVAAVQDRSVGVLEREAGRHEFGRGRGLRSAAAPARDGGAVARSCPLPGIRVPAAAAARDRSLRSIVADRGDQPAGVPEHDRRTVFGQLLAARSERPAPCSRRPAPALRSPRRGGRPTARPRRRRRLRRAGPPGACTSLAAAGSGRATPSRSAQPWTRERRCAASVAAGRLTDTPVSVQRAASRLEPTSSPAMLAPEPTANTIRA